MYTAVSLGETCQTRFQVIRHLFYRMYPDAPEEEFRKCITQHEEAKIKFKSNLFDWQITPFSTVCHCLESDFDRIFEREDLRPTGDSDNLINDRFDTLHPHSIHPAGTFLTEEELDAGYREARDKIDFLTDRFREMLKAKNPHLYIYNRVPSRGYAERLLETLKERADHPFKILFFGPDEENIPEFADDPLFDVIPRPLETGKPADLDWEGNDNAWESILKSFPIRLTR